MISNLWSSVISLEQIKYVHGHLILNHLIDGKKMKLLQINSSVRSEGSHSNRLSKVLVERLLAANPGAALTVQRFFGRQHDDGRLEFTHRVHFSGPLGGLFAALLGRGFMRQLPEVMTKLQQLAQDSG